MIHVQKKSMEDLETFFSEWLQYLSLENCGITDETVNTSLSEWLGKLQVSTVTVEQLNRDDMEEAIATLHFEDSELWQKLSPLPKRWSFELEGDQLDQVQKMLDSMMLRVFQGAYDVFVNLFGATESTRFFTVQTMVISAFLLSSYVASDEEFYAPIVDLYKQGHCIIGISGNKLLFS